MTDDLTLLNRWRSGDRRAGQTLVRRHYRGIFDRLRKGVHGNADVASDLAQRVFVAAVSRLDGVEIFERYLHGIARFILWEHLKKHSPQAASSDEELGRLLDPRGSIEWVLSRAEDVALLVEALQTLSIEEQAYLMWSLADGLSHPEIARRVGLTRAQVNGRIHRARRRLRHRITALCESPEQRQAIRRGFETWMRSLRRRLEHQGEKVISASEHR